MTAMKGYCKNCGDPIEEGEVFCDSCGMKLEAALSERPDGAAPAQEGEERIRLCPDGKYRWYGELPMFKNPAILFTVWKVLGLSLGIVFLIALLANACDSVDFVQSMKGTLKVLLIVAGALFAVSLIAYFIAAASYGFRYRAIFEMDEEGVTHTHCPRQFKKTQALAVIAALAGALSGRPSLAGAGLLGAARSSMTSEFANVKKIKISGRSSLIRVNGTLQRNVVFTRPEDLDFAAEFIIAHCPQAKVKGTRKNE